MIKFPQRYHDVALVRLDRVVPIRPIIHPACLSTHENIPSSRSGGENLIITAGWGTTSFGSFLRSFLSNTPTASCTTLIIRTLYFSGGKVSNILQKIYIPLIESSQCENLTSHFPSLQHTYPKGVEGRVICAGTGGKDSCQVLLRKTVPLINITYEGHSVCS